MKVSTRNFCKASPQQKYIGNLGKFSTVVSGVLMMIFLAGIMLLTPSAASAQFWTENFSYGTGTTALTASGNWNAHSGAGTNALTASAASLTYSGHPGSGIGFAVPMTTSGEDANRAFTSVNSGTVYASFLVKVSAASTGDYFAGLYVNSSTFATKVYIKSATGGFNFGVTKNTGAATYESTVRTTGTTYLIVVSYTFNGAATDDIVNLWVDPVLGAAQPAATITLGTGITDNTSITGFYLRQGTAASASTQTVDAIIAGNTWASVTPIGGVPVVSGGSVSGTVGTLLSPVYQISATNAPTSYALANATTLPNGLTLNTTSGQISGTPTVAGSFSTDVTASNGAGAGNIATLNFTIAQGSQTITGFPTTDTRTYTAALQQYNLTGVGGGSGNAVTYVSDNPSVASISGSQVTINGAGTAHITASQAGNANWLAASNVVQTLTVNKATQTITFGALSDKLSNDPNFQLTATGGGSTSPIIYTSSNTSVAIIVDALGTPDPNGSYVDIVGPGLTTITASQAGDANYLAATPVAQTQNVINANLLNQTITFNALAPVTYGDAPFQLTATGGGSGNPVTFTSGDNTIATCTGTNGATLTIIKPGTVTITANQAGDGVTYNPAPPVSQSLTINVKQLTVSNASVVSKPYDGTTAATITGATLNGVVGSDNVFIATFNGTFADPNANTGIAVTANLTLGGTEANRYSLAQPAGLTGTINKATQTITFGALANKAVGDPNFNLTATAAPSGLPVTYTSSDPSVASVTSGGLVHIGVIGSATITASQAGNQNYLAATPVQQTQTVVAATPVSIFANTITDANPSATNPFTAGQTFNPNITVNGISRGTGLIASSASNRFSASDWTLNASPDANDYFEFSLTPNVGYKIDFSSLVFSHQRSTQGPATYVLKSSADNYTASLGTGSTPTTAGTVTLPLALTNISANIKFRLYAYSATGTGGTYSVNDFIFNGNVSYAPPTGTYVVTNVSACGGTNDGTITVTPSGVGPFTYSWTGVTGSGNPASTPFSAGNVSSLTGLPIGYYNVTITDANLNSSTISGIHVQYAFSAYITNSGSVSSACGNTGSIILYANAGVQPYTYSLDGITYQTSNTFLNLAAGTYTAYLKDGAGCVSTKSITVAAAAPIVVSPFVRNASSCSNDGSIEVYRTGGISPYSYSMDGTNYQTSNKFLNLAAGTYTVYVKDSKGCVASQTATVTQGAALGLVANKSNTSTCVNDGSIQLIASGGTPPYTYSIDGVNYQSSNTFTGLGANTYVASVKDFKNCAGSVNVTINLNPINVTAFATPASSCEGTNGTIQLFRTGGVGPYTYSLDGNTYQSSNLFTGLIPGYYEGYVKDSKTCVNQLIDIYVGPECGQRAPVATKGNVGTATTRTPAISRVKVTAYPNPSASDFLLSLEGYNGKVSIVVTDMMGRQVYQTETSVKQFRLGNNFKPGLYNVQVIQGTEKKSIKIVKE